MVQIFALAALKLWMILLMHFVHWRVFDTETFSTFNMTMVLWYNVMCAYSFPDNFSWLLKGLFSSILHWNKKWNSILLRSNTIIYMCLVFCLNLHHCGLLLPIDCNLLLVLIPKWIWLVHNKMAEKYQFSLIVCVWLIPIIVNFYAWSQ